MKKIKVLQIVYSLGIGGNEIFVMNHFRHIDKERFQVDFLIFERRLNFYNEVVNAGSNVYIAPDTSKMNQIKALFSEMNFIYQILKNNKYDVVHCHNCSLLRLVYNIIPAKLYGKTKIIAHSHSKGVYKKLFAEKILRSILKKILSHSIDLGFACSDIAGQNKYTSQFRMSEKYNIIPNAVDTRRYYFNDKKRNEIRNKLNINNNEILIGNVGRLSNEKNQKFLIELLSFFKKNDNKSKVLIVGGGELEETLKSQAVQLGVADKLIITGMVDNANEYYSAMDVFVMPSLFEGLPFAAVEAQANGLKCVFSDNISRMSNISGDVNFLSLQASMDSWQTAIITAAHSRSNNEHIQKVLEKYDLDIATKKLEETYAKLVMR